MLCNSKVNLELEKILFYGFPNPQNLENENHEQTVRGKEIWTAEISWE